MFDLEIEAAVGEGAGKAKKTLPEEAVIKQNTPNHLPVTAFPEMRMLPIKMS